MVQQILLADDRGGSESAELAITVRGLFSDVPSSGPRAAKLHPSSLSALLSTETPLKIIMREKLEV